MAAIFLFFCFIANWPFWPRSRQNILLNFTFDNEAKWANLQSNKSMLKWRPFWNMVYTNVNVMLLKNHRSNEGEGKEEKRLHRLHMNSVNHHRIAVLTLVDRLLPEKMGFLKVRCF